MCPRSDLTSKYITKMRGWLLTSVKHMSEECKVSLSNMFPIRGQYEYD